MNLNDIYDLIPWETLKHWAKTVSFNGDIVNPNFPKYQGWSEKAIFADYLMDYVEEGFNVEQNSYPKAVSLKGRTLPNGSFIEIFKLFFDSSAGEEHPVGSPGYVQWQHRLEEVAGKLKESFSTSDA